MEAGPCSVTQIKTVENDGYSAVQVAFADKKEKVVNKDANGKKQVAHRHGVNKAQMGHFAKAGVSGKRFVKEFKFENAADYNLGLYLPRAPTSRVCAPAVKQVPKAKNSVVAKIICFVMVEIELFLFSFR